MPRRTCVRFTGAPTADIGVNITNICLWCYDRKQGVSLGVEVSSLEKRNDINGIETVLDF